MGNGEVDYQVPAGTHTLPRWQSITLPLTSAAGGGAISVPPLPDVIAQCYAALPAAPNAQDGCHSAVVGTTLAPLFFKQQGDFTIVWSFADTFGNSTTANQAVHVHDTIAPVIACPGPIAADAASAAGTVIAFAASATDNCAPPPIITYSQNPGLFVIGTTTVTATATDHVGNQSACQFTVTVRGPRAIELDVLARLQALLPYFADQSEARKLSAAIDDVIEANNPAFWIDDSHLQLKQGEHVFDQKRKAVHKLAELVRKDTALAPALQPLIAREVLACRILVEVALPSATGKSLAEAQRELAMGDQAMADGDADKAIGHYGSAWKAATR